MGMGRERMLGNVEGYVDFMGERVMEWGKERRGRWEIDRVVEDMGIELGGGIVEWS